MSQSNPDNRSYSVDEMLDKLRDGERTKSAREDGEIVTRSDGSQALRVRKRKRRSKQKKDEIAKRKKVVGRVRLIALIAVPLLLCIGLLLLLARYHSSGFAGDLRATVSEMGAGTATFKQLHVLPTSVSARTVTSKWPEGSFLEEVRLDAVKADLKWYSFLTGQWSGELVRAEKGLVTFSQSEGRQLPRVDGEALAEPDFARFRCDYLSAFFGKKNSNFRISGTSAVMKPRLGGAEFLLEGGELVLPGWGQLPIQRATLLTGSDRVEVVSFRLGDEPSGQVVLSGALLKDEGEKTLNLTVNETPFSSVIGRNLGQLVMGRFEEEMGLLTFDSWNYDSHQVHLEANPSYVTLAQFEFLEELREIFQEVNYKSPEISSACQFTVHRSGQTVELRDIDLRETGVVGLRGNLKIDGQRLSGDLEVGLPTHKKLRIPNSQKLRFERACKKLDGFDWVPVKLGGTVSSPSDDFGTYFTDAPEPVETRQPVDGESLFDQLTR
ncbi:MAG: hypothetical protein Q7Q71_02995 [Verrucomicrobiota bacterium JB023]|nr:hypothetical protein [Verrucomicrobiota bacterium JB023]